MLNPNNYSIGEAPYRIDAQVLRYGKDITVLVGGGTQAHIGAVAVAISHPSIKDASKKTVTASVVSVPGHKEDELARLGALQLSRALDTTVLVSVGIHVDDASMDDIKILMSNFDELIDMIQDDLQGQD